MIFFLCNAFNCILLTLVIQLTPFQVTSTTCFASISDHSIGQDLCHHSIDFINNCIYGLFSMPMLNRSMAKSGGSSKHTNESNNQSSSISLATTMDSKLVSLTLPTLSLSQTLSSLHETSSSLLLVADNFEISNFATLEVSNSCLPTAILSPSFSSQNLNMELECNDKDNTRKVDPDPPDTQAAFQHDIMKILTAISSQIMANYKDLQDQFIRNDLNLTIELQRVIQGNDAFKQEIRQELQSIQNTTIPSTSSTIPNTTNVSPSSTAAVVSPQVISSLTTTTT
jgi:hypothetical protein